jgi:hypothetical protein
MLILHFVGLFLCDLDGNFHGLLSENGKFSELFFIGQRPGSLPNFLDSNAVTFLAHMCHKIVYFEESMPNPLLCGKQIP